MPKDTPAPPWAAALTEHYRSELLVWDPGADAHLLYRQWKNRVLKSVERLNLLEYKEKAENQTEDSCFRLFFVETICLAVGKKLAEIEGVKSVSDVLSTGSVSSRLAAYDGNPKKDERTGPVKGHKRKSADECPPPKRGRNNSPSTNSARDGSAGISDEESDSDFDAWESEEVNFSLALEAGCIGLAEFAKVSEKFLSDNAEEARTVNAPIWRKILDFTHRSIGESPSAFDPVSYMKRDLYTWCLAQWEGATDEDDDDSEAATMAFLTAISQVPSEDLIQIFARVGPDSYETSIKEILRSGKVTRRKSRVGFAPEANQHPDFDVAAYQGTMRSRWILEFGRCCCETMGEMAAREGTERDLDVSFHVNALYSIRQKTTTHFGELESRASRDRRVYAAQQLGLSVGNIRGTFVDWLVHVPGIASNEPYGVELSALSNVGNKRSANAKRIKNKAEFLTLLRDIHRSLALRVLAARGKKNESLTSALVAKLPVLGIFLDRFRYEVICLRYVGRGFYAATTLRKFDAPVVNCANFPQQFVSFVKGLLLYEMNLTITIEDYLRLLDPEEKLPECAILDAAWRMPDPERSAHRSRP
ncbi:hypothetical protein HK104_009663 [Borealophlyctis nickersoniae]|nr:hypothetical protein HK104_009663 [Borealophlyctis nickersoniae]